MTFKQDQFLNIVDRDEARSIFFAEIDMLPLGTETVSLGECQGRILAENLIAPMDVPAFDRSNVDGYAVHAENTFGAAEDCPLLLKIVDGSILPGDFPARPLEQKTAWAIATGAMIPRGSTGVVMVENTMTRDGELEISRSVSPGANISFAGSDISRGETLLRKGEKLTSRETGVLAALGIAQILVFRKPRVAILSTGNEIIAPGTPYQMGKIYDSNSTVLADTVREMGAAPTILGIIPDQEDALEQMMVKALEFDMVLLSGGTSKGQGDISFRVIHRLGLPGILVHGVALKPGKPLCLAVICKNKRKVPIAILPGFPTSAIFTFREIVSPALMAMVGESAPTKPTIQAKIPFRINSEMGRTEFLLVSLTNISNQDSKEITQPWNAFPLGKGSGSVTAFSKADGFIVVPKSREYLEANEIVQVQLFDKTISPCDLVIMGSHCVGLDFLIGELGKRGIRSKWIFIGSTGGVNAVNNKQCDLAGIHLFDEASQTYNDTFLNQTTQKISGYERIQGIVFRKTDSRFQGKTLSQVKTLIEGPDCMMVNRNRGSGTRILMDQFLGPLRPQGHLSEVHSHTAVVAAIEQGRADWGMAIESAIFGTNLGFLPISTEQYDFACPEDVAFKPGIMAFRNLLLDEEIRLKLKSFGLICKD